MFVESGQTIPAFRRGAIQGVRVALMLEEMGERRVCEQAIGHAEQWVGIGFKALALSDDDDTVNEEDFEGMAPRAILEAVLEEMCESSVLALSLNEGNMARVYGRLRQY
jgi:hypothetical protein